MRINRIANLQYLSVIVLAASCKLGQNAGTVGSQRIIASNITELSVSFYSQFSFVFHILLIKQVNQAICYPFNATH